MLALATIYLLVFWAVVHFLHRKYLQNRPSLLPTNAGSLRSRFRQTEVSLNYFHLKIETTACNAWLDNFASRLSSRRHRKQQKAVVAFYNVGVGVGILGMLGALTLLLWMTYGLWSSLLASAPPSNIHARRGLEASATNNDASFVQAIVSIDLPRLCSTQLFIQIPGVTVPLSHLLPILVSLLLCQLIHEAGHAVAAAVYVPFSSLTSLMAYPSTRTVNQCRSNPAESLYPYSSHLPLLHFRHSKWPPSSLLRKRVSSPPVHGTTRLSGPCYSSSAGLA